MAETTHPDLAIVDVKMPGGGGTHAAREIRRRSPQTHVVAFSAHEDRGVVLEMIRAGAVGYLLKGASGDEILSAVHRSILGEAVLAPEISGNVVGELAARMASQGHDAEEHRVKAARIRHAIDSGKI